MYNRILVPLDGSEFSECSLGHVKQVAAAGGLSEVILLRVMEPVSTNDAAASSQAGYTITEVQNKNKAAAQDYLSRAAEN